MGKLGTTIKRFISNKNTVTLIAIIVCTVILYIFYNNRVKNAVKTQMVCYAKETIPARTVITKEMVSTQKVLSSSVSTNQVTTCDKVIGMYASYAVEIPQNSYFYKSMLMTGDEMPDSAFRDIPDGYTLYNLAVNFQSTYGNAIFPGNRIDLYLKTKDPGSDLLIYGKFIQSIEVKGVKDKDGKNVFETTVETRTPSQLLFSVPEDLYLLLKKAEFLGLQIVIVPRNSNYTASKGETLVSSEYLKKIVLDQTQDVPDECVLKETATAECEIADTTEDADNQTT